jgi:hypothetical protein
MEKISESGSRINRANMLTFLENTDRMDMIQTAHAGSAGRLSGKRWSQKFGVLRGSHVGKRFAALATLAIALFVVGCADEGIMLPGKGEIGVISLSNGSAGGGPPPAATSIQPGGAEVSVGDTLRLYAYDSNGNQLEARWSVSDQTIAQISETGLVTGVSVGSAEITARTRNVSATTTIKVIGEKSPADPIDPKDPTEPEEPSVPATVQVLPSSISLVEGETKALTADVKDADGTILSDAEVTWSSANAGIAQIDSRGVVTAKKAGTVSIHAVSGGISGSASVTVNEPTTSPAPSGTVGPGIWISKAELDAISMGSNGWTGSGELKATADASWTPQPIEQQSGQVFHAQALAGALVYARLVPDASAAAYRTKVANAIKDVISFPVGSTSVTAPSRHLGTWAISADLIDLKSFDATLDSQFRAWLRNRLDHSYSSSPSTIRLAAKQRPNNIGAWSRFSLAAASVYLGDSAELNQLAGIMRFWLGDRTALAKDPFEGVSGGWGAGSTNYSNTWQQNPNDKSTWRGIVAAGVTRDGNRFDGIQPEDQWRNKTGAYSASNFPGDKTDHRYPEESFEGTIGAVLILHRAGHTNLLGTADSALLRAARSIKYFADNYSSKGYEYFTGPHEASRPLINYLYPSAGLPGDRARNQMGGKAKGFAWTYWTHGGRSVK